jgi:serine protease inhibitor
VNERDLYNAITDLPDDKIERAYAAKPKPRFAAWQRWAAVAAAAAVVAGAVWLWNPFDRPQATPPAADPAPSAPLTTQKPDKTVISYQPLNQPLVAVKLPSSYPREDMYAARMALQKKYPVSDAFAAAVDGFAAKTTAELLADRHGNAGFSPLSLYYALAVTAIGAEGKAADELYALLGVPDKDTLSTQCHHLFRQLYVDNDLGRLQLCNSLWIDHTLPVKADFADNAARRFYAEVLHTDFQDAKTADFLGQWVSDHTDGLLKPAYKTQPNQYMALINTVYFKDVWVGDFDPSANTTESFTRADGGTVSAVYMNAKNFDRYDITDRYLRAEKRLGNDSTMVFVLPEEGSSPQELLASPQAVTELFADRWQSDAEVIWKLPKFDVATKWDDLVSPLRSLGVNTAFEPDGGLSGISDGLYVDAIEQDVRVRIDERGVEAAAATEIRVCGDAMDPRQIEMTLDRPFLYGILSPGGQLLFVGVVEDPTVK